MVCMHVAPLFCVWELAFPLFLVYVYMLVVYERGEESGPGGEGSRCVA